MSVPRGRALTPTAGPLPGGLRGRVLLVGEGDLSFALALACARGPQAGGLGLVATTYDSEADLKAMYDPWILRTLEGLRRAGARVLHGVDATQIADAGPRADLDPLGEGFDAVVWNHPHAGFPAVGTGPGFEQEAGWQGRHRAVVAGFLHAAGQVLRPGGFVHMAHKSTPPFSDWDLPALASEAGLSFGGSRPFPQDLFPGFTNRRGHGKNAAKAFPMGDSRLYTWTAGGTPGAGGGGRGGSGEAVWCMWAYLRRVLRAFLVEWQF